MKTNTWKLSSAAALALAGLVAPLVMTAADNPPPAGAPPAGGQPANPSSPTITANPAAGQPGGAGGGQGAVRVMRGGGGPGGMGGGQGGTTFFQGRGGMGGMPLMGGMFGMNLDDQQRQLLREAMQKNRDAFNALDEKLRAAQRELMQATLAENYDEKVVHEKAEVVAKIQTEIIALRSQALATLAPTLKPDQRDELLNARTTSMLLTTSFLDFTGNPGVQVMDPTAGGRGNRGGRGGGMGGGGGFGGGGIGGGGPSDGIGGGNGGNQPRRQRANP